MNTQLENVKSKMNFWPAATLATLSQPNSHCRQCVEICVCVCILKGNTLSLWPWTVGWAQPSRRGSGASLHCARRCSTVHQAVQGHPHLHCLQSYHRSYLAHIGTSSTLPPSCHWFSYRTIWHYDKALMFTSAPILCCHHRPEGFQAKWETESWEIAEISLHGHLTT